MVILVVCVGVVVVIYDFKINKLIFGIRKVFYGNGMFFNKLFFEYWGILFM